MIHIPILRAGRTYRSLKTVVVPHIRTGEPFVEVSQANTGLIAKDLRDLPIHKQMLSQYTVQDLISMCNEAAHLFTTADLPLDTGNAITCGLYQTGIRNNWFTRDALP